ncbi:T9SS type A sorting domain-containing protein [Maribellus sediminis]|uniref:T9SS type A sorting domain-containing protein n=1 Tax=Maribellus sediminis TaxID=2696285 RepID=UPI0014304B71|nr:T9SS type A sorting domain-containing protein [Maribellus sediminis]
MKKFTRNFLSGGHSRSLLVLRSFALALVALVGLHSLAHGQTCDPPPGTVHFYADNITPCYNGTNTYEVELSVMDFQNVDTLSLVVNFDGAFWVLDKVEITESAFKKTNSNPTLGTSNSPMTYAIGANSVTFNWAENVSRGYIAASMGAQSVWAKLTFKIKSFPNNSLSTYATTLDWDGSRVGYCIAGSFYTEWFDVEYHDGSIIATKDSYAITVSVDPETVPCDGMKATATVDSPVGAGYSYSFNGINSWADYEDGGNVADLYPGDHTVYVMDANGCMSRKNFTLDSEGELTHTTLVEHEACDHLGEITIVPSSTNVTVSGYWTVPDAAYQAYLGGSPLSSTYKSTQSKTLVPAGIWWTAAETECGLTPWVRDSVAMGASFDWDGDVLVGQEACGVAGVYAVAVIDSVTDSTSVTIQLIDIVNSVLVLDTTWAIPTPGDMVNDTFLIEGIAAGSYEARVTDGGDCTKALEFDILPADDITFGIQHTDVACSGTDGIIWVTNVNGDPVAGLTETYGLYVSGVYKDVNGDNQTIMDTIWDVSTDSITDLPAGVYEAYLFTVPAPDSMGCTVPYNGINGNEVVLFDNGIVTFKKNKADVTCFNENDGKIWITDVVRNCITCNPNPYYVARLVDTTGGVSTPVYDWTPVADVATEAGTDFNGLMPGVYMIEVKDTADGDACVAFKFEEILSPDTMYFVVDTVTPPTCYYGNDGQVRLLITGGTPPYAYSIDNAPNWTAGTAFNLEQGQSYYLQIRDKWGTDEAYCTYGDSITVPALEPIIIEAFEATEILCSDDDAQVGVKLVSYTHWADSTADYKYYRTETKVAFSDPVFPDPDEVRAGATAFKPWTSAADGDGFEPGKWYIYAIDKFGCVAEDEITIKGVSRLVVDSLVVTDANCNDTWSGSLTIYVKPGSGIPDSVYYYRYANNYDVLNNDPDGIYNTWRAFDYDTVNDESFSVALSAMTAGKWYVQVKDGCTDTIIMPAIVVEDWGPIEVGSVDAENVTCYGKRNGTITVAEDEITGGAPAEDPDMYHYLYTLVTYPGNEVVKVPKGSTTAVYSKVTSPVFTDLVAGDYRVIVYDNFGDDLTPEMCPPDTSEVVTILEPCPIEFTTDVKHVSCAGAEDAEVTLYISGGVGGTYGYPTKANRNLCQDVTKHKADGNSYYVTVNSITNPDQSFTRKIADGIDTLIFQTQGGEYEIYVTDELNKDDMMGCYADTTVTVFEPQPWTFTDILTHPTDCDIADGVIKVKVEGGFLDTAMWSYWAGPDTLPSVAAAVVYNSTDTTWIYPGGGIDWVFWSGDTITISDTAYYGDRYELIVMNDPTAIEFMGLQLSKEQCPGKHVVTMENFIPYSLDMETTCATCNGDDNGSITMWNLTGGNVNAYQVQFVSVDSVYDPDPDSDKWWPEIKKESDWLTSADSVTYDKLTAGEYYIFIKDSTGNTLQKCCRPFPFAICEPAELVLDSVVRIQNVLCEGDSTGAFQIYAHGGVAPYKYWYSRTSFDQDTFLYPGVPDTSLFVTDSVMSNLPTGAYIGWVMDANGCIIGCDITEDGFPRDEHRVIIRSANALDYESVEILGGGCYLNPVDVVYHNVTGGSGDSITVVVMGEAITSDSTTAPMLYTFDFDYTPGNDYTLTDILPGKYEVKLETNLECPSSGDSLIIDPGYKFIVTLDPVGGEGCPGDNSIWVQIVTEGGTAPYKYVIKDEAGAIVRDTTTIIDHLLKVGRNYIVEAYDMGGCMVMDQLNIEQPQPITFEVENITCFGAEKASARVNILTGTANRMFKVQYKELEGEVGEPAEWTTYNGEFSESIDMKDTFIFDDVNPLDVHYMYRVVDEFGCVSDTVEFTYDMVDGPLQVVNVEVETGECSSDIKFEVAGGTAPYRVKVDDVIVADGIGFYEQIVINLGGGEHIVEVLDAHYCNLMDTITADYSVVRDTMVSIYVGDTLHFVDAEAMVDTMVTAGMYSFHYLKDSTCSAELNLEVTEREKTAPVLVSVSPDTDTIANNHPEALVITFSDDVTFTGGGTITITGMDAETPAVTITLDSSMFSGNTVTVTYDAAVSGGLDKNTTYYVNVDSAAVMGDGLVWGGIADDTTWTFTTGPEFLTDVDELVTTDFKVYPNPFNSFIRIDNAEKLDRVVVTNIAGQRVLDIENPTYEIRTGNLVTGVYVVTLISNDEIVKSERIIKR